MIEQTVQIAFYFHSDGGGGSSLSSGWYIDEINILPYIVTNAEVLNDKVPLHFQLSQNYPNPFNPTTNIRFTIPEVRFTILKVYDVLGKEVATLVNEELHAGEYEFEFNSRNLINQVLTSGVYFYQLKAGNYIETKKMLLIK